MGCHIFRGLFVYFNNNRNRKEHQKKQQTSHLVVQYKVSLPKLTFVIYGLEKKFVNADVDVE